MPLAKLAEQAEGQLIPPGPIIVPLPVPASPTVRVKVFPEEVTVVDVVAELFVTFGSAVVDVTFTVFVTVPAVVALAIIVTTWGLAPLLIVPRLHVTVVVPEQLPWEVAEDTNVTPAGNTSVAVTFAALSGPLFVTVIV